MIDVYRRRFSPVRNPVTLALYISLFPQLVAGPIVRYSTIARQLVCRRSTWGRASAGARIFVIGLAQKVLVADQVAQLAECAFDRTAVPSFAEAWIGTMAYTIQIYFDFCGYSNMAVGLGFVLGFRCRAISAIPTLPCLSPAFWRRWHISLSSWLRDYLYIAMGGSRGDALLTYRNLAVVFLLCVLWHGANWTFVLWGAWHGAFLILERVGLGGVEARMPVVARWLYTILAVMGGWVLFRAPDLGTAVAMYSGLLEMNGFDSPGFEVQSALQPVTLIALAAGWMLSVVPSLIRRSWLHRWPVVDGACTLAMLLFALLWIGAGTYSPFLYFRF